MVKFDYNRPSLGAILHQRAYSLFVQLELYLGKGTWYSNHQIILLTCKYLPGGHSGTRSARSTSTSAVEPTVILGNLMLFNMQYLVSL